MNKLVVIFAVLALISTDQAQPIDEGWKGVKPLVTTKGTVNKLFGKHNIDSNGYYGYRTEVGYIQVEYSTEPCVANQYDRGRYSVPEDIVLRYDVHIKKPLLFSDLIIDKSNYFLDTVVI